MTSERKTHLGESVRARRDAALDATFTERTLVKDLRSQGKSIREIAQALGQTDDKGALQIIDYVERNPSFSRPDPAAVVEAVEQRTATAKTFDLGNGEILVSKRMSPIHYQDSGEWEEIDLTFKRDRFGKITLSKAPYLIDVLPGIGYRYISRASGWMQIELLTIDGSPVVAPTPRMDGNEVWWDEVRPGLSFQFVAKPAHAEIYKHMDAPHVMTWRVTDSGDFPGQFNERTRGRDATRHSLELITSFENGIYTEEWTGRVSRIVNEETRQKAWFNDPDLPVVIDATITENIAAGADDGHSIPGLTMFLSLTGVDAGIPYASVPRLAGFRFQTVPLPVAATPTAASLTVKVLSTFGSATVEVFGNKVGDAPAWDTGNRFGDITRTTASTTFHPLGVGIEVIDVLAQVIEIHALPAWAENNAMALALLDPTQSYSVMAIESLEHAGTDEAQLDITYTGGAAPGPVSVSGNQPFATGALIAVRLGAAIGPGLVIGSSLSFVGEGAIGAPDVLGILTVTLTGTQPAAGGALSIAFVVVKRGGVQPASSGALSKRYKVDYAGAQPAATGALSFFLLREVALSGSQPSASGLLRVKQREALSGAQPAPSSALVTSYSILLAGSQSAPSGALRLAASIALSGNQPSPSGSIDASFAIALSGSQPSSSGALSLNASITLSGAQPAPAGVLSLDYVIELAGSQLAATGTLSVARAASLAGIQPSASGSIGVRQREALSGNQPSSSGALALRYRIDLSGSQPAASGATVKGYLIVRSGSQPASTGALAVVGSYSRSLSGSQPSASGSLSVQSQGAVTLAGVQPAAAGVLSAQAEYGINLAGVQPASTGAIRVRQPQDVIGSQPPPSGALSFTGSYSKALVGAQPAPAGALSKRQELSRTLLGAQPAASGAISSGVGNTLAGSQPASSGALSHVQRRRLSGVQPPAASTLAKQYSKVRSGVQPSPSGSLLATYIVSFAGSQPSGSGAILGVFVTFVLVSGTQPAPSGLALSGGVVHTLRRSFVTLSGRKSDLLAIQGRIRERVALAGVRADSVALAATQSDSVTLEGQTEDSVSLEGRLDAEEN